MANMASVAYAIEGSQKSLVEILGAICLAVCNSNNHWEEYQTCINLGFTEQELEDKRLGGEIDNDPTLENGVLRFYAEERWGLQDFEELLIQKFPDIKVYWVVEEPGCEVYSTNDKEGKYFPERYWVDTAQDDIYQSEYFKDEESMWQWLTQRFQQKIHSMKDVEKWNEKHEELCDDDENFINIYKFAIID